MAVILFRRNESVLPNILMHAVKWTLFSFRDAAGWLIAESHAHCFMESCV